MDDVLVVITSFVNSNLFSGELRSMFSFSLQAFIASLWFAIAFVFLSLFVSLSFPLFDSSSSPSN